jgi:hypothetical protein
VSYQSSVAALATAVHELTVSDHATTAVLRGIDDPYRLYQGVFTDATKKFAAAQEGMSGLPKQYQSAGMSERFVAPALDQLQATVPVKAKPVPLVHQPSEIPGEATFGYVVGAGKPGTPLYLDARPNISAADLGKVQEAVVMPGKMEVFPDYNTMIEKYGSLETAWKTLSKRGVDTVQIERGSNFEPQTVVLDHSHIMSSRPVTPEAIAAQGPGVGMTDAETMLRNLANEPIEVALSKRMPDFAFDTPVKRADGTYDLVFRKRGAPGLSPKQRSELGKQGFFTGQNVLYGGKMYEVAGVTEGRVKIRNNTTGQVTAVAKTSVLDFPSVNAEIPVDEAIYRDFKGYFNEKVKSVYNKSIGEQGLKDIAKASADPFSLRRDLTGQESDVVLYPEETLTQAQLSDGLAMRMQQVQAELGSMPLTPATSPQVAEKIGTAWRDPDAH